MRVVNLKYYVETITRADEVDLSAFFGSAINNFGVKEMLDAFVEMAPPPGPRAAVTREVSPYEESFSGFAFKIQANMNPAHNDRIAFIRICSGKFTSAILRNSQFCA